MRRLLDVMIDVVHGSAGPAEQVTHCAARAGFLQARMSRRAPDTIGHQPAYASGYSDRIVIDRAYAMTSLRIFLPLAIAVMLAPLSARAQRADVCALVSCSASGQRAAAFDDPVPARPAVQASATPRRPAPEEAPRDPWARRFQGRETEDEDVCLLNVGIGGQLARKGTIASHVLGRTQTWRAADRNGQ
jgi:hypothetical protein